MSRSLTKGDESSFKNEDEMVDKSDIRSEDPETMGSSSYSPKISESVGPSDAKRMQKNETEAENNNEGQSTFCSSPVEKALQNSLVLQNIFKFLPYNDLLNCEAVNHLWLSEARHSLRQRSRLSITLPKSEEKITMVQIFQGKKVPFRFKSISELITKLETYGQGPEIRLRLDDFEVNSENLDNFLVTFVDDICALDLVYDFEGKIMPSVVQELLCILPNVTNLTLNEAPTNWEYHDDEKWNLSFLLPQIQTLIFRHPYVRSSVSPEMARGLFQIMPNLKNVHGLPLECINFLAVDDHFDFGKIKSFVFRRYYNSESQVQRELTQLADISPKTKLQKANFRFNMLSVKHLEDFWDLCCESLYTILRNNQSTLTHLIIEPMELPQFLEYPNMKAVNKLCLVSNGVQTKRSSAVKNSKFFDEKFNVHKTFPNLNEVTIDGPCCSAEEFLELFPDDAFTQNYFPGVTSLILKLEHFEKPEVLEKFAILFPNVTKFFMDINLHWLEFGLPQIFRLWSKLISLKCKVNVWGVHRMNKYWLDPVFTGISSANCAELRKSTEKLDINLKLHRKHPGIPSMTELTELTLIFHGNYGKYAKDLKAIPFFSHVTPIYGFQCLPRLKVTCAIPVDQKIEKIREMLSPIEKLVDVNPNY